MTSPWWRQAVLYHIYPLSFSDSNGDGYGDLTGIFRHLDYLSWLGVGAVWMSPIYRSPMKDWGYDITDHKDIDPIFGDLFNFDKLLAAIHQQGMKLLLDFVPNHTSNEHPWFKESRRDRINVKRDWYIWAQGKPDGSAPNNWLSHFGGSAWTLDPATGEYYLHSFMAEQPDLNWRNPEVRTAMLDVMRFWLARGVDGFRTDAVYGLIKDKQLRDNPANPQFVPGVTDPTDALLALHSSGQRSLNGIISSFCNVLAENDDRFLVSEAYLNVHGMHALYGACSEHPLHAPFNFNLMTLPWNATAFREFIDEYEASIGSDDLPNYVLGNHDRSRLASRVGAGKARLLALLQLTLRGMPVIYYGDELGLKDSVVPDERVRDPWGIRVPGYGFGRDGERSPMPWSAQAHGGFSSHKPWLPLGANAATANVESEQAHAGSLLNMYRRLIQLRRLSSALLDGKYEAVSTDNDGIFAFTRTSLSQQVLIVLNFSDETTRFKPTDEPRRLLVGTHARVGAATIAPELAPFEGRVYLMSGEEIA